MSGYREDEFPKPPIAVVLAHLVGRDVDVPYRQGWAPMRCPFPDGHKHGEDRNASASVNRSFESFRCHGCGRQGDGVKLLQTELRLTLRDAIELAKQLGTDEFGTASQARRPTRRRVSDILGG